MNTGWLAVIISVSLIVVFIIFAENSLACHRWWQKVRPWNSVDPHHVPHAGFCSEKLPPSDFAAAAAAGDGRAGCNDLYTAAAGIGVVGGVLSGSTPVEANPAAARELTTFEGFA